MRRKIGRFTRTKAKLSLIWLTVLAVTVGMGLPVAFAEVTNNRTDGVPASVLPVLADLRGEDLCCGGVASTAEQAEEATTQESSPGKTGVSEKIGRNDFDGAMDSNGGNLPTEPIAEHLSPVESELPVGHTAAKTGAERSIKGGLTKERLAMFVVPHQTPKGITTRRREIEAMQLPQSLTYQYAYGSDTTEITYLKNRDLNSRVQDDSVILGPNLFGIITYRPNAWLETTLEMRVEQLIAAQEETQVILPDGTVQVAEKKRLSLLVDQAHVTFKEVGPFNVTVGRRNFEDGRLWLYDAPLDGLIVKLKQGDVHTEASVTRENYFDGELLYSAPRGKINNYMLYTEYRGIEDSTLAAYAIKRDDTTGQEGEPLHLGMRAYGRPTDNFNYWTELGFSRGRDELKQKLKGYAFDVGGTYRFLDLPLQPSATLRYAFGSGDSSQDDNTNHEFRQTGLQSNEGKFGGVTQFKTYGEMLDPELTNLKILTAGVGCRPAENTFVDLVYNHYQLAEMASGELFSSGLTALMNLDDEHLSKDVGSEIDLILGFRNLFGLRGVGFDLRMGWFFPGKAYRLTDGDPADPTFRKADQAVSVLAVFIF